MKSPVRALFYRLWQVRQQLGFVSQPTERELEDVAKHLPARAFDLFTSMSAADQQHALRVCRGLQELGWTDKDILTAALLHDVGKAAGRVPFWTRPIVVLARLCSPKLLTRLTSYPVEKQRSGFWRALSYAWWHAEFGADLVEGTGLSERAVYYIRMHHQPDCPELAALHLVDEAS